MVHFPTMDIFVIILFHFVIISVNPMSILFFLIEKKMMCSTFAVHQYNYGAKFPFIFDRMPILQGEGGVAEPTDVIVGQEDAQRRVHINFLAGFGFFPHPLFWNPLQSPFFRCALCPLFLPLFHLPFLSFLGFFFFLFLNIRHHPSVSSLSRAISCFLSLIS